MVHSHYLEDEAATIAMGQKLAGALVSLQLEPQVTAASNVLMPAGAIVYLLGDLGAGKTTLTRGVLRGLGFEGPVKSPTYTLVEPYELDECHIYHFDFYRLGNPEEVEYLGVEEYFQPPNLCIVEWADRGGNLIPGPDLVLNLSSEANGRRLNWSARSTKGGRIGERLFTGT